MEVLRYSAGKTSPAKLLWARGEQHARTSAKRDVYDNQLRGAQSGKYKLATSVDECTLSQATTIIPPRLIADLMIIFAF